MNQQKQLIYWEKQGYDQLCGVHCINSLLQGPYFNEIDLATIAQELDRQEIELLGKTGHRYKSQNVAEDGNFSIQVLAEALKKLGDLQIESVDSKINQNQDLSQESGFICNSQAHWFSIRKIENIWYNLNSTNKRGPEIISDFYLSAFLQSVKENGYSIFVVKGVYPPPQLDNIDQNDRQKVLTTQFIKQVHDRRVKKKNYQLNIGGSDEIEMKKALKASKGEKYESTDEEFEEELQQTNKMQSTPKFQGQGIQFGQQKSQVNYPNFNIDPLDAEYRSIILMTLEQKFNIQLEEGLIILFQLPNGQNKQYTFSYDATVEDLYDFIFFESRQQPMRFTLICPIQKLQLLDVTQQLLDIGIDTMTQIIVKKD
ncbi:unnamed protein product [Paramecium primaurelia]|uniref:Ataxin-3 homolog n=1 Tax=Paramecium primaurelia TaxID=5886 RepID=A0A8S1M6C4_PARPR|nr:unnamed protein product [Paramecium primaurelia]